MTNSFIRSLIESLLALFRGMATSPAPTLPVFSPVWACACSLAYVPSLEEACIELTRAIEAGDMQSASVFAATLARQHAMLKIQPTARDYEDSEIR